MPLHPPGLTPCTLKETESAAPVYTMVVKTSCHITQCIKNERKVLSSYKSRSLASKCPQRISLVCAPERDVTKYKFPLPRMEYLMDYLSRGKVLF
jgi:hypothetical protein